MSEASAQYKKQDGKLLLSTDGKTVSWKSARDAGSSLSIAIADIQNLKQTPVTAAKASIKIVVQNQASAQPEDHTFTFTSASAREDQQAITGSLRRWIEASKTQSAAATPTPRAENGAGLSAAMAMAQTVSSTATVEDETYNDAKLVRDVELQKSLLNSSPALRQRFDQALRDKPETITISQFAAQFWATRVHMLRSHAAERSQSQGTYNVLSVVKPVLVDNSVKLSMTKEQIQLIFSQHPIVKRVYNENVPDIKEGEFWSRFFNSRLCKKLKGEKVEEKDPPDPKFDRYLNANNDAEYLEQIANSIVPHFIDVEANEQNNSQRKGNRPDAWMRPASNDKEPIMRVLNKMSERMLAEVPHSDAARHNPAGVDEETYQELQLRDLERAAEDNRVVLKVHNQDQMFAAGQNLLTSSSASTYTKRTPAQALSILDQDLRSITRYEGKQPGINLDAAIGFEDESSSDEEDVSKKKRTKVGSSSSRNGATSQILRSIRQHISQDGNYGSALGMASDEQATKLNLSQTVFETLSMTHNTTIEFLHYFWSVFLSGDPDRAAEVKQLADALKNSLDRIQAVEQQAESERQIKVDQIKRDNEIFTARTQKKRRFDPNSVKGGKLAVDAVLSPLKRAIRAAVEQYNVALAEQQRHFALQQKAM
ncbi:RNA polymerase II transcription factor [Polyplosphaeria fusca]|uniref:RNA polymerase II transcription factor n=1 Tax=Polyplosphaeria fusca TaxID=682080 RepID=A0A9P4RAN2_9PLEO|nr:RNA polymerase II transcription factor [Polyplosphaeria fusca]